MGLKGRVAIVTGASRRSGIGAAICRSLAAMGADIFFTHWNAYDHLMPWGADDEGPHALQQEVTAKGVRCQSMELDLSQPQAAFQLLDTIEASLGQPSILVNNAAYSTNDGYQMLDVATLDAHYAVNMRSTLLLSVEFVRRYPQMQNGRIVNLTSGQSLGPMPEELAYIATKGAVEAFTLSLAAGVAALGITVNAVNPGPTDTGWMSSQVKQDLLPRFPQGRLGQPTDVAKLVSFLVSEEAGWITGQIIHSEGGFQR